MHAVLLAQLVVGYASHACTGRVQPAPGHWMGCCCDAPACRPNKDNTVSAPVTLGISSSGLRPGGPVMMLTKAARAPSSSAHHQHFCTCTRAEQTRTQPHWLRLHLTSHSSAQLKLTASQAQHNSSSAQTKLSKILNLAVTRQLQVCGRAHCWGCGSCPAAHHPPGWRRRTRAPGLPAGSLASGTSQNCG